MTATHVHIFIGTFDNRAAATAYTEGVWEPEPDETATDEEYAVWEDRNPIWPMREALNCYLDSDFIETITDEVKLNYFNGLVNDGAISKPYQQILSRKTGTLVLIFELALPERQKNHPMTSTDRLEYIGKFPTVV